MGMRCGEEGKHAYADLEHMRDQGLQRMRIRIQASSSQDFYLHLQQTLNWRGKKEGRRGSVNVKKHGENNKTSQQKHKDEM